MKIKQLHAAHPVAVESLVYMMLLPLCAAAEDAVSTSGVIGSAHGLQGAARTSAAALAAAAHPALLESPHRCSCKSLGSSHVTRVLTILPGQSGSPRTAAQSGVVVLTPCYKQAELPPCFPVLHQMRYTRLPHGHEPLPGAPHAEVDEQQRLAALKGLGVGCNIINVRVAPAESRRARCSIGFRPLLFQLTSAEHLA